MTIIVT